MKKNSPRSSGPGDNFIKNNFWVTWLFEKFSTWIPGTEPILKITKYIGPYRNLNYMAGKEFCLIFSLLMCHYSFGLCISEHVFIIQWYFYCILIHIFSLRIISITLCILITLNLTLHWPLCKVRGILLLKKRENCHVNLLHLSPIHLISSWTK